MAYQRLRRIDDGSSRPVIDLEGVNPGARVMAAKIEDRADIGGAKRVKRLVVVTDRPQLDTRGDEMGDQVELARVNILVFVDQHVVKGPGDRAATGCVVRHRPRHQRHHVGEIDRPGIAQRRLVDVEELDGRRVVRPQLIRLVTDHAREAGGVDQPLLHAADQVDDVDLLVPPHPASVKHMPLLRHIPQIELFRETEALGLAPQVPEGEGVKGVDRQSLRAVQAQQADDAVLHLDRRLPSEGHGQDPARIDALPNQMHKTHGQGGRLARAGSGQGQLNGCGGGGGGALRRIEPACLSHRSGLRRRVRR